MEANGLILREITDAQAMLRLGWPIARDVEARRYCSNTRINVSITDARGSKTPIHFLVCGKKIANKIFFVLNL